MEALGCFVFRNVSPRQLFVDPVVANAYTYETLNDALFTSLGGFPSGFASPFSVSSEGTSFGLFGPGDTLTFPGIGVSKFTISGIDPAVDGSSPTAFPIRVGFDRVDASVRATAFSADDAAPAIPEPSSILLLGTGGLALIAKMRRKKKQAV